MPGALPYERHESQTSFQARIGESGIACNCSRKHTYSDIGESNTGLVIQNQDTAPFPICVWRKLALLETISGFQFATVGDYLLVNLALCALGPA